MYRFFGKSSDIYEDKIYITGEDYKHIKNSLRLNVGEHIYIVIDDSIYDCVIFAYENDRLISKIIGKDNKTYESNLNINLFQALMKGDKNEFIIQKATELGVNSINFFNTERVVVKIDDKKWNKRLSRYEKIALEASKQSKRTFIPTINDLVDIKDIEVDEKALNLVCYEKDTTSLKSILLENKKVENINILVGPEGGLSEENIKLLKDKSFIPISLGPRILRGETAPLSIISIIGYELGDMG